MEIRAFRKGGFANAAKFEIFAKGKQLAGPPQDLRKNAAEHPRQDPVRVSEIILHYIIIIHHIISYIMSHTILYYTILCYAILILYYYIISYHITRGRTHFRSVSRLLVQISIHFAIVCFKRAHVATFCNLLQRFAIFASRSLVQAVGERPLLRGPLRFAAAGGEVCLISCHVLTMRYLLLFVILCHLCP